MDIWRLVSLYLVSMVETYGVVALSERSCEWFQKFKNGEFDIEDKENVAEGRKCTKTRNWKYYWIKIRAKRNKNNTKDNTSNKT